MKKKILALFAAVSLMLQCAPADIYGADFTGELDIASEDIFSSGNEGGYETPNTADIQGNGTVPGNVGDSSLQGASKAAVFVEEEEQTGAADTAGQGDMEIFHTEDAAADSSEEPGTISQGKTNITECDIQLAEVLEYTGGALTPEVTVSYAGQVLVPDWDYTVAYADNTVPGTASVTVTGINNYEGTAEKHFKIMLSTPRLVSAVSRTYNSTEISWDPVPGAQSYVIYYKGNTLKSWVKLQTGITTTSFTHISSAEYPLVTGKKYTYTVRAVYNNSMSGYEKAGIKVVTSLETPTLGTVKSAAYNKLKITWNKVPGATSYNIYRKSNGSWVRVGTTTETAYIHKSSSRYPVKTGVTYTYTVRAIRKDGSAVAMSNYNQTGIRGKAVPDKAVLVSAECTAENKITIRWKKSAGATGYLILRRVPKGKWELVKKIEGASMIGYTHVSSSKLPIEKGKTYIYTVRSYTKTGNTFGSYDTKGLTARALTAAGIADEQATKNAEKIVAQVTNNGMSQAQKLKACFDWVISKPYVTRRTFSNFEGWPAVFANDHFVLGGGNCHSDAAAFAYLAKVLGYTNVYVCTDADGRNGAGHSWTEINGLVYDPLFAEAKNYYGYFGVGYGSYKLHPILHIRIS